MKKQIRIWLTRLAVLAALTFAVYQWGVPIYRQYFTHKEVKVFIPTTKVKEGDLTISVQEVGNIEAENSVTVTSDINGKIISIVADGTIVSVGDEIVVLDTTDIERDVKEKELAHNNALADVDRVKAELELLKKSNETDRSQAEAQLEFDKNELELAKKDLEKKERLLTEKLVTGTQVEQAKGIVRSKELAVTKQEAQLGLKLKEIESKENQKKADIENAGFRAGMAKSNLERSQQNMSKAIIKAPAAGLVVISETWTGSGRRKMQSGDDLRPRQDVCSIPDLSVMQVKVKVGEADMPKINLDMPVIIRLEAVPGKEFHGKVADISNLASETPYWMGGTPGKKEFEIKVSVDDNDPKIVKPGMSASLEFICDKVEKAVYVPIEAVIEQNKKTYVFVKNGDKYDRTEVEVGKQNNSFIVIKKGLKKDQVIALCDPVQEAEKAEAEKKNGNGEKKDSAPIPGNSEE